MEKRLFGISAQVNDLPELDPDFYPIYKFNKAFLKTAQIPVGFALERDGGQISVHRTAIHASPGYEMADKYYIDRFVKTILWMDGGYRLYVQAGEEIYNRLRRDYAPGGARSFDAGLMAKLYEHSFEVISVKTLPEDISSPRRVGGHLSGCRIGLDAGGSCLKVCAVEDGRSVFSDEIHWSPKEHADPQYHFDEIVSALRVAGEHLPRVDAVGISSAGVYVSNRTMAASLFLRVPQELFESWVKDIYIRAVQSLWDVPICVCNDGDVSALWGAMALNTGGVLGISMGTAEGGGYVDGAKKLSGKLTELAFMPLDVSPTGAVDEWSGDVGCGVKYLSRDGVLKLADRAATAGDCGLSPAERLYSLRMALERGDDRAAAVYRSVGVYLGHSLAFYNDLCGCVRGLIMGGVVSGGGGEIILDEARRVLSHEYPEINLSLSLPDEKSRYMGQAIAAASLPEI